MSRNKRGTRRRQVEVESPSNPTSIALQLGRVANGRDRQEANIYLRLARLGMGVISSASMCGSY
jgi:hypothetical protein